MAKATCGPAAWQAESPEPSRKHALLLVHALAQLAKQWLTWCEETVFYWYLQSTCKQFMSIKEITYSSILSEINQILKKH
jgi:hypothetical protein